MKNSKELLFSFICFGLFAAFLLPCISWLVWSFGLPVGSMFSAEGLRWLFQHAISHCFNELLFNCVLASTALGVWQQAVAHPTIPSVRRRAILSTMICGLFMLAIVSLAAFHPESPLLSINGTLAHSPFSQGIFPFLFLCSIVLGVVYAFVLGLIRSSSLLVGVLVYGVQHYASWLLLVLVYNFDFACLQYILGGQLMSISIF